MRKAGYITMAVLAAGTFLAAPLVAEAGGTIKGNVLFKGEVPPPKEFKFGKFPNPDFCKKIKENNHAAKSEDGETRLLKEVVVRDNGGLVNAIVSVRDIEDKEFIKNWKGTDVVSELCDFLPYTDVVVNKKNFHVENHDADPNNPKAKEGVLHNPHSFEVLGPRSMTIFNIALATKGASLDKMVKLRGESKGSVFRLQCDQHEYMQGWYVPVKNPHYDKVDPSNGAFEIKDVPAGKHKVMAWHPVAGKVEKTVEVPEGGTVEVTFEIK